MSIESLLRANIRALKPYTSARDEYTGEATVLLDANENPYPSGYNRYPDPYQRAVKEKIAALKGVNPHQIFLGNGSDEAIDLLIRAFCNPGVDKALQPDPTYGMYEVSCGIQDVPLIKVPLTPDFQLDVDGLLARVDAHTKLLFICSPNNPTGNAFRKTDMVRLIKNFPGIVVVDEAYIDFSTESSMVSEIEKYPRLVVLQTFSKAWGMAGIRLGMAFAQPQMIQVLNKIKPPYNISALTQEKALEQLERASETSRKIAQIVEERKRLVPQLEAVPGVQKVFASDANFLLVKVAHARKLYAYLVSKGIIVRDRSKVLLCDDCLRMTIGTPAENQLLVDEMNRFTL
jgi:histidinol-phosphate aminotransferase